MEPLPKLVLNSRMETDEWAKLRDLHARGILSDQELRVAEARVSMPSEEMARETQLTRRVNLSLVLVGVVVLVTVVTGAVLNAVMRDISGVIALMLLLFGSGAAIVVLLLVALGNGV